MRLDWAILAKGAEGPPDGLVYILGAGIDTIWVPSVPAMFMGSLVLRILGNRAEANRPVALEVQCNDEDGNSILPTPISVIFAGLQVPPQLPVGWDLSANVVMNLSGMPLRRAGRYSFEILLNGAHVRSQGFRVLLGAPPGTQLPSASR